MAGTPVTEVEREQMRALHAEGRSRNAIARELGRSVKTITRHCAEMGLSFDRSQTAQAVAAAQLDAKARRRQLADDLLGDVERLRAQIWGRYRRIEYVGREGRRVQDELDTPPPHEQLAYVRAPGLLLDKHLKLDLHDADTGTDTARSMPASSVRHSRRSPYRSERRAHVGSPVRPTPQPQADRLRCPQRSAHQHRDRLDPLGQDGVPASTQAHLRRLGPASRGPGDDRQDHLDPRPACRATGSPGGPASAWSARAGRGPGP